MDKNVASHVSLYKKRWFGHENQNEGGAIELMKKSLLRRRSALSLRNDQVRQLLETAVWRVPGNNLRRPQWEAALTFSVRFVDEAESANTSPFRENLCIPL